MSIVPFDGYQASRDELIANNWYMEESGNIGGSPRFWWERWVSSDNELMATFYWTHEVATVCRNP